MRPTRVIRASLAAALAGGLVLLPASAGGASGSTAGTAGTAAATAADSLSQRYLVVLAGTPGSGHVCPDRHRRCGRVTAATPPAARVATDLRSQIGVVVVESANPALASDPRGVAPRGGSRCRLALEGPAGRVAGDARCSRRQATTPPSRATTRSSRCSGTCSRSERDEAHAIQGGIPAVDVGILDTGIDGNHVDFKKAGVSNVDCARGHNSVTFLPTGPGVGTPDPCIDNQFHGTHVAGTIGARANGLGHRRGRAERHARPRQGLRRLRLLLRERRRRRHHLLRRPAVRRHQHELLRRRQRVPGVHRVQVHGRPGAAGVPPGRRARDPVRPQPGCDPGRGAGQLRRGPGAPVGDRTRTTARSCRQRPRA